MSDLKTGLEDCREFRKKVDRIIEQEFPKHATAPQAATAVLARMKGYGSGLPDDPAHIPSDAEIKKMLSCLAQEYLELLFLERRSVKSFQQTVPK